MEHSYRICDQNSVETKLCGGIEIRLPVIKKNGFLRDKVIFVAEMLIDGGVWLGHVVFIGDHSSVRVRQEVESRRVECKQSSWVVGQEVDVVTSGLEILEPHVGSREHVHHFIEIVHEQVYVAAAFRAEFLETFDELWLRHIVQVKMIPHRVVYHVVIKSIYHVRWYAKLLHGAFPVEVYEDHANIKDYIFHMYIPFVSYAAV